MTDGPTGQGRRPDGVAFIIAGGLAALGALLIWQGSIIPDKGGYAGIGSGTLPQVVGWGLVALAAGHVWTGLKSAPEVRAPQAIVPVLLVIEGLALQLVLLKPLGF
ncbi:MAG: tripartite tricarboxylate transporter TctB family protein, partial [Paracoccaceae bacterium]